MNVMVIVKNSEALTDLEKDIFKEFGLNIKNKKTDILD